MKIFSIIFENINFELNKKIKIVMKSKTIMSKKYHDYFDVFSKKKTDKFFFHRKHNHKIELMNDKQDSFHVSFYNMFEKKLQLIKTFLKKHLNKKFIVFNFASFVFSILFVKKSNEELRFCVNYRRLNVITKKNRYSLSLIFELMNRFSKTKIFIKINIKHAFNRIKMIIKKNENFIIFKIRFEIYKFLILSFELTNDSILFQHFINDVCMKYLDEFLIVYLNDLLIYSNDLKKHKKHV